jgi:hypothetical protein
MPSEEGIDIEEVEEGNVHDAVMDLWYVVESNSWLHVAMLQCEIPMHRRQDWKD